MLQVKKRYIICILCFLFFTPIAKGQSINPYIYLATLRFGINYQDYFVRKSTQVFPVCFLFNITQDGNNNGIIDVEDACENIVGYAIGDSIYGTSRSGLVNRGPNNQSPAIYFNFIQHNGYDIYQYWLYYADNDYLNNHEHDWEKYFVYVKNNTPHYIGLSSHKKFIIYPWANVPKEDEHPIIGVRSGSHAMDIKNKKGVEINYKGEVKKRKGKLIQGDNTKNSWKIYCNNKNVTNTIFFKQAPDCFFNGDPLYKRKILSNGNENEACSPAPWKRMEWEQPPMPSN
ncbi:MAG: NPP1 family protein [Bacteroidia bacterium]